MNINYSALLQNAHKLDECDKLKEIKNVISFLHTWRRLGNSSEAYNTIMFLNRELVPTSRSTEYVETM